MYLTCSYWCYINIGHEGICCHFASSYGLFFSKLYISLSFSMRFGSSLNIKTVFPCMMFCVITIRRSWDCIMFMKAIHWLVRLRLYHYTEVIMGDGVPNHQPHHCLLTRLFGRRSTKISKLLVHGLYGGHRWSMNSPHKWPVTRKMFPFDDVIMYWDGPEPTLVLVRGLGGGQVTSRDKNIFIEIN